MDKTCGQCQITKPINEFYKAKGYRDGRKNQCKTCVLASNYAWSAQNRDKRREYGKLSMRRAVAKDPNFHRRKNLKRQYGITLEECEQRFAAQGNACAICRESCK